MIDFAAVGKKLVQLRKEKGLTQEEVAEKLFVTRQLISKWENGTGIPSTDALLEFCRLYQTSFENILCLDEDPIFDRKDIFRGHERTFVIESIINGKLKVDLPDVLYQMSPAERMLMLRGIRDGKLSAEPTELIPKLTPSELQFYKEKVKRK